MATISSAGTGSGIDIGGLVSSIIAAEAEPTTFRLDQRESRFQAELTGLGSVKSALSSFKTALESLTDPAAFQNRTATSADPDVFTATATTAAVAGSFGIEVTSLAEAHKLASTGFSATTSAVGSGSITLSSGSNTFSVSISSSANTVADIRDAINDAAGNTSVSATVLNVDDGMGGTESRLVLTATATGTANEIRVTVDDDDGFDEDTNGLSRLVYDPLPSGSGTENLTEQRPAADSVIEIDQQTVTSSGNTVTDAIEGVTLTLVAADPGTVVDLTVGLDKGAATAAVNDFVSAYNNVQNVISGLSTFDASTGTSGILLGDATVRTLSSQLRSELGDTVSGLNAPFSTLAEIGVTTEDDGTLSVDSTALDAALDADFDAVGELFGATDGVATRLETVVNSYVQFEGIIDARTDGLQASVDDITDQRVALDRRLVALEERLLAQFIAMDSLVSGLQADGDFLTRQFAALQSLQTG